jgi:hypothetical protein
MIVELAFLRFKIRACPPCLIPICRDQGGIIGFEIRPVPRSGEKSRLTAQMITDKFTTNIFLELIWPTMLYIKKT